MVPIDLLARLARFAAATSVFCRPLLMKLDTRDAAVQLKRAASSAAANHRAARVVAPSSQLPLVSSFEFPVSHFTVARFPR